MIPSFWSYRRTPQRRAGSTIAPSAPHVARRTPDAGRLQPAVNAGSILSRAQRTIPASAARAVTDTSPQPTVGTPLSSIALATEADARPPANSHAVTRPAPSETRGRECPSTKARRSRISTSRSTTRRDRRRRKLTRVGENRPNSELSECLWGWTPVVTGESAQISGSGVPIGAGRDSTINEFWKEYQSVAALPDGVPVGC